MTLLTYLLMAQLNREMFYFDESFNHGINVKLDRDKSPKTGTVNFVVPLRISFQDRMGQWKEYFRAVNRSMQVLPRGPTIPRDSRARDRKC